MKPSETPSRVAIEELCDDLWVSISNFADGKEILPDLQSKLARLEDLAITAAVSRDS